jgi:hypothetical protein
MSTSDFDARLLEIWKDAGHRMVIIPMSSLNSAITFRQRLYRFRQEMKKEKHELWDIAKRAGVSIQIHYTDNGEVVLFSTKKNTPIDTSRPHSIKLSIQPTDDVFDSALEAAGYKVAGPPSLE